MTLIRSIISLLRPSTWSYVAWALLYAATWLFPHSGRKVPVWFAQTLAADFLVNIGTPFIMAAGAAVYTVFSERDRPVPWYAWPLLAALVLVCAGVPLAVLHRAGGWLLVTGTVLFFTHAGWHILRRRDGLGAMMLFARGLFGPWIFMMPALVVSAIAVKRQTLGFGNTDWVPLFGVVYFGMQAAFEELMLRKAAKARA